MALDTFLGAVADIAHTTDATQVKAKSRDWHFVSPLLSKTLEDKVAEAVITPASVDQVLRIAAAAWAHDMPLTPRGTGTANYGTTGIITEMELPLAPAWAWNETIVTFDTHMDAVHFGIMLADCAGITRKFVSVHEWPTPSFVTGFRDLVPEGKSIVMTMIADHSWESFAQLAERAGGTVLTQCREGEGPYGQPLWEFIFGHMLFQIQKNHPERSVIEGFFRAKDLAGLVARVHAKTAHYGPLRLELLRIGGEIVGSGSPYFVYESAEQMAQMVRDMQEAGAVVSNSHTTNVRAVGKKEITDVDIAFKRSVDPYGLLNPGRFEVDETADAAVAVDLPTDKWTKRLG